MNQDTCADPEYYLAIAEAEIVPNDGSQKLTLEYVLLRGFEAMGVAEPGMAANDLVEAAAVAIEKVNSK